MREAIVGYSFGSANSKSNIDLARVADSISDGKIVVLQWELAALAKRKPRLVVRKSKGYLDTGEVTRKASAFLKKEKIRRVWVVAQPFLHRRKCVALLKKEGFTVEVPETGRIRFDSASSQWWTRNPINLLVYAVLQKLTGRKGR